MSGGCRKVWLDWSYTTRALLMLQWGLPRGSERPETPELEAEPSPGVKGSERCYGLDCLPQKFLH